MSAKWVRSQQWEREHLAGWLLPVRWLLHSLSTITLAVVLLSLITIYGVMASIPVGLIALSLTYAVYGLTLAAAIAIVAGVPAWGAWRVLARRGFAVRFSVCTLLLVVLTVVACWLWSSLAWPHMRYSETTRQGLRLFPEFVSQYKAVSIRRTPWLEMTELQFYGWWPLKVLLFLFVLNMFVATVRRIEFSIPNIGVLTVHSGIILLGIGSAVYAAAKQEGDVLLLSGPPTAADQRGAPTPGPLEVGFYDNTDVVLRTRQARSVEEKVRLKLPADIEWQQRPIRGLPRYNDYHLSAAQTLTPLDASADRGRTLDIDLPSPRDRSGPLVDSDIQLRVVGYAAAAELSPSWREVKSVAGGGPVPDQPVRYVQMLSRLRSDRTPLSEADPSRLVQTMGFMPGVPSERLVNIGGALSIEYLRGVTDERWRDLTAGVPPFADPSKRPAGGLIVEIPGAQIAKVFPIEPGSKLSVGGYTLEVTGISPRPPFPIITPGFEGASSSVAIVRVTPPSQGGVLSPHGDPGDKSRTFERYVYSRFPELTQDLSLTRLNDQGMPLRSEPSVDIRLAFLDSSAISIVMDERADGSVRAIVRLPGAAGDSVKVVENLRTGDSLPVGPLFSLRLGERLASVERAEVPVSLTGTERERDIGTHKRAAVAVEVSVAAKSGAQAAPGWRTVRWLPFHLYASERAGAEPTTVALPDGRRVELDFGRLWRPFPGLALQLADFEMIPYPHSTQPQDFRSDLLVHKFDASGEVAAIEQRRTSLNDPLLETPHVWRADASWLANASGWLSAELGSKRFKFSQSGWDSQGWTETKGRADKGELLRPYGRFTILGVGNNPGIRIIAFGSVLTCLGVPWAFYVKPWLVRRKGQRLAAAALARSQAQSAVPAIPPTSLEVQS